MASETDTNFTLGYEHGKVLSNPGAMHNKMVYEGSGEVT